MKQLKLLFYLLFFIINNISCEFSSHGHICWEHEEFFKKEIDGVINEKFIDRKNHGVEYIFILNKNKRVDKISMSHQVWNFVNVGDSIKKNKLSDKFTIIKPDESKTIIRWTFYCPEKNRKKIIENIYNEINK